MTNPQHPSEPILSVEHLSVGFHVHGVYNMAVDDVSFQLWPGETLGIVGESGSGKSVTALSIMRLLASPPAKVTNGHILFRSSRHDTVDLRTLPAAQLRHMIFQEPMTSLNPVYTCGNQVMETLQTHRQLGHGEAKAQVIDLFREVQLPRPEKMFDAYPHEISGGQKQRVMIAMAMACEPAILIADEPTTALDVTVQANILRLLEKMRTNHHTAVIFITHDLGVIAEIADRILVMREGRIVEQGTVLDIFSNPQQPYTQGLLACRPRIDIQLKRLPTVSDFLAPAPSAGVGTGTRTYRSVGEALLKNVERRDELIERRLKAIRRKPILRVRNLSTHFPIRKGIFGRATGVVKAVDDVQFDIFPGETVGLVGESGCGKTTLGRTILRLVDPTYGEILFEDREIQTLTGEALRVLRKEMQIIFQDPYASLNPRMSVGEAIMEPMLLHGVQPTAAKCRQAAYDLLEKVGLSPASFSRFPHEFSGGQRQRVCIARALALQPKFIVCDESVSALDVSVQAQVLNLLNDLKEEFHFTYIFISHDLSVIRFIADRIFVMNNGKLVEMGYPEALFERPKEEYTRRLINAIPRGDIEEIRKTQLKRKMGQV